MARDRQPRAARQDEYETIADAVRETERGRWFLDEHARRSRGADLQLLFDTTERLQRLACGRAPAAENLSALAAILATARERVAEWQDTDAGPSPSLAPAAARLSALAGALRDVGGPEDLAVELSRHAAVIEAAEAQGRRNAAILAVMAAALDAVEGALSGLDGAGRRPGFDT